MISSNNCLNIKQSLYDNNCFSGMVYLSWFCTVTGQYLEQSEFPLTSVNVAVLTITKMEKIPDVSKWDSCDSWDKWQPSFKILSIYSEIAHLRICILRKHDTEIFEKFSINEKMLSLNELDFFYTV